MITKKEREELKDLWFVMTEVHRFFAMSYGKKTPFGKKDPYEYGLKKMCDWMSTKNPHLGWVTPTQLFLTGRIKKVRQFVQVQISENKPCDAVR